MKFNPVGFESINIQVMLIQKYGWRVKIISHGSQAPLGQRGLAT